MFQRALPQTAVSNSSVGDTLSLDVGSRMNGSKRLRSMTHIPMKMKPLQRRRRELIPLSVSARDPYLRNELRLDIP